MNIANIVIEKSDAGDGITIGDYLKYLLNTVWHEGEGFSGKRPFGNSGWEYELYLPLIKAGIVGGKINSDGYLETFDKKSARNLITNLINQITFE